ncbi:MAG: uncharacterized protein QOF51_4167 [Chloroflexota bacterium]|jgi:predicted TIM-barrel fold metal-dependent hydrolase|nr:uncharacterized protein [Chloroflexota bacterium]
MSYHGHRVIDMDSHVREYWDLDRTYQDYIDPQYRETYAQFSAAVKARQRWVGDVGLGPVLWPLPPAHPLGAYDAFAVERDLRAPANGAPERNPAGTHLGHVIDPACNWDPAVRLRDMDQADVDVSVMFPSQSDGFCMLNDVGFESALHWAYHRYMSDYCAESEGRLFWIADVTARDVPETIRMLEHWTKQDPYFAGIHVPRALPDGTMLDNPVLHPLFAVSQELDMPIWIHGGSNRPPYTPWVAAPNAIYHGWGGQFAMAALIGGGVFDRFPRLRFGLFESGCGWMPWLVEKLDGSYHPGSKTTPFMKRTPSEIVASGQLFCSVEAEEGLIPEAVDKLGEDVWLFSTDYPHPGTCWPEGVPLIVGQEALAESARLKLFETNAERFLPRLAR